MVGNFPVSRGSLRDILAREAFSWSKSTRLWFLSQHDIDGSTMSDEIQAEKIAEIRSRNHPLTPTE